MGPSMIFDGDVSSLVDMATRYIGFNGAVDDLRRRRQRVRPGRAPCIFFIGAFDDLRRRRACLERTCMETLASMGPSMIFDGDTRSSSRRSSWKSCFNGAVDDLPRRLAVPVPRGVRGLRASMGPS